MDIEDYFPKPDIIKKTDLISWYKRIIINIKSWFHLIMNLRDMHIFFPMAILRSERLALPTPTSAWFK